VSGRRWSWRSRRLRGWVYQALAVGLIVLAVAVLLRNTLDNMQARGIHSGFGFLFDPAGFDIGESPIRFESIDSYGRAFLVGTLNTLRVAALGIVLATVLGVFIGVGRTAGNVLLRGACTVYVEAVRNIPVLLQLMVWYIVLTEWLPGVEEAIDLGGLAFISKNGLSVPWPEWAAGALIPTWSLPHLEGLALEGGAAMSPEFLAVLLGLVFYTAAFIGEVVRAGITSVPRAQVEAGASLGLPRGLTLRRVVLPQALRVIIPPVTSQYLNLTKNSSLAVAIGYPDVVSIANTSLNQTGRAVECIVLIMAVYLTLSLLTALGMSAVNRRSAIQER
jgi:general L-amino acid transport system permease protein